MDVLSSLVGSSPGITAVREQVRLFLSGWSGSRRPPPVLIQGETGTGKGLLARALHPASPRAGGPFIDVNCAAIPDSLLEAELFGYERGAFTDARQAKPGLFQLAHRGTLFLDEIGLLPQALQAKLLSVLEERAVRRLGATRPEAADVWIISATNEDLTRAIRERRFRQDLYHRIAVVTLALPPLRARGDDVVTLAEHFLTRACADYGVPTKALSDGARAAIRRHPWPGNVRELSNSVERAALLSDTTVVTAADLALTEAIARLPQPAHEPLTPEHRSSRDESRQHLDRVLSDTGWNISRTAAILGVSRNTVTARIVRFGLRGPRKAGTLPLAEDAAPAEPAQARGARWEMRRLTFLRLEVTSRSPVDTPESALAMPLAVAADKLRGFGGRVEGSGRTVLLAAFGIEAVDEHAVQAGHSALVIRRAASEMSSQIGLKLGLHSVEVPVRIGAGHTVVDADASRLAWNTLDSALASEGPGAIVATASAAALMRRRFALAPIDQDARIYRVHGLWRNDIGSMAQRGFFAGRREELALLESRYAAVARGRGHAVALGGDAGIGKSRLLLELIASPRLEGAQYLEGRCLPAEVPVPYLPLLQIVTAACGIDESDGADVIEAKVQRTLASTGTETGDTASALLYLLSVTSSPPETPGDAVKKRLFAAIRQLLVARSARGPLVVVVEDLHWIDPTSEACLAAVADALPEMPVLLATTHRTGYRPPWTRRSDVLQLTLAPLSEDDSFALIRAILDERTRSEDLERKIQTWGEGNPLFLEELSRGALERGDGSLGPRIPATIEDTIEARLGRLPLRSRRLLSTASVIGHEVPLPVLREASELSEPALGAAVSQLERADFLHPSTIGRGEPKCAFKHALVQETAYAKLGGSERRVLHIRVLDAIERLYADRITDHVERLAHHAMLGEAPHRAVPYLLQAGRKAAGRFALEEAMSLLNRGLALLARLPESAERDQRELSLLVTLGMVVAAGKGSGSPEAADAFARALAIHERVPDFPQRRTLLIGHWFSCILRAEYATAQRVAEQLERQAERDSDPVLEAMAHQTLGMTALYCGRFGTARDHLERSLDRYRPEAHRAWLAGPARADADLALARYRPEDQHARTVSEYGWPVHVNPRVHCLAYLSRALWSLGYPDRALATSREAVAQAQTWGGALNLATALGMLAITHQLRREPREVLKASEQTIAHASEWRIQFWLALAATLRALAQRAESTGATDDQGVVEIERSLNRYRATGTTLGMTWFLTLLAEAYRASGRLEEALGATDEARALVESTGERYHEAEIALATARIRLAHAGAEHEAAAEHGLRQALEIARDQQAKGWELRAAIDLARLLHRRGRSGEGRELLAPVYGWFTEGFDTADLRDARALLDSM